MPALAADKVKQRVDVIAAPGTPATIAAQEATQMVPIIFVNAGDPVGTRNSQEIEGAFSMMKRERVEAFAWEPDCAEDCNEARPTTEPRTASCNCVARSRLM